jgi:hypothetical protein
MRVSGSQRGMRIVEVESMHTIYVETNCKRTTTPIVQNHRQYREGGVAQSMVTYTECC